MLIFFLLSSYLNQQHIQKLRFSEADQKYGHITVDINEQHMEIGKFFCIYLLNKSIFN